MRRAIWRLWLHTIDALVIQLAAEIYTAGFEAGLRTAECRELRLAEQQGALLADVIRAILADLNLTKAQQALVAVVVPAHLRAITGGAA